MLYEKSLVSIISPTYNGAKYLAKFLESVLEQKYAPIELIVIDDGSTDETQIVLASYEKNFIEKEIRYSFFSQENKGQAAAINLALKYYTGEYLMWVDSDDVLLPNNVLEKVNFLNKHPEYGFVLGQGEIVNASDYNNAIGLLKRNKPSGKDTLFSDLIFEQNVVFCPGVIMVRAKAFQASIPLGQIYESREGQNWQMMLPIAYNYECGYIDKVVFKCVEHNDSHSRRERSYEELITRQSEFEILLTETIRRIVQMPIDEKNLWCKKIAIKHSYNILKLALDNKDFRTYNKMRKKIKKNGGKVQFRDSFLYKSCKKIKDKLKGIMYGSNRE